MKKMNPVIHFEMPAGDSGRMSKFYETTFGWKAQQMGPEMGNYVVVSTTESDERNMPKNPGAINGGFFQKTGNDQYPSVVVAVDDIRQAMKDITAAGGTVIGGHKKDGEPDEIPGVGLYASFLDTEGNRLSVLQPMGM
ncbi:MAG TPA: VOC family protein [Chitinophagaceae bacterium]|jgi:hypothetical protein